MLRHGVGIIPHEAARLAVAERRKPVLHRDPLDAARQIRLPVHLLNELFERRGRFGFSLVLLGRGGLRRSGLTVGSPRTLSLVSGLLHLSGLVRHGGRTRTLDDLMIVLLLRRLGVVLP